MKTAFVSDFDGTISFKDFYRMVMDKYHGKKAYAKFDEWQAGKIKDVDFLNYVFNNMNQPHPKIWADIYDMPIDETAIEFINSFTDKGGDFFILSAGCAVYINFVLEKYSLLNKVTLIANPGTLASGNIYMTPDASKEYYSEIYGVDKGKAVSLIKQKYEKVYFAGDSRPDMSAARVADVVFAKSQLAELLSKERIPFESFSTFSDIANRLHKDKLSRI